MVNFGYPYNVLVICKDSTDYLYFNISLPLSIIINLRTYGLHTLSTGQLKIAKILFDYQLSSGARDNLAGDDLDKHCCSYMLMIN